MIDLREFMDNTKDELDNLMEHAYDTGGKVDDIADEIVDYIYKEYGGYKLEAGSFIEDSKTFFMNHKVACFILAGIEVAITIVALLI